MEKGYSISHNLCNIVIVSNYESSNKIICHDFSNIEGVYITGNDIGMWRIKYK